MGAKSKIPVVIEIGSVRLSVEAWSEKTGIPVVLIKQRLKNGWNPIDAVNTPRMRKQDGFELMVGKETKTVSEWARIGGVNQSTIRARLSNGWDTEKAIFTKVNRSVKPESAVDLLTDLFKKFLVSERMRGYRTVGKIYRRLQQEELMQVA